MSRDAIPPPSHLHGPTIEQLADIARAQRDSAETMVECPACESCALCRGAHMVTPEQAEAFAATARRLQEGER